MKEQPSKLVAVMPSSKTPASTLHLPSFVCQSYIAIFEDGLDQLGVLADIEPDVSKTNSKPVRLTHS